MCRLRLLRSLSPWAGALVTRSAACIRRRKALVSNARFARRRMQVAKVYVLLLCCMMIALPDSNAISSLHMQHDHVVAIFCD